MATKFNPGDVVKLASGGSKMTVVGPGETSGYVWCEWHDKDGKQSGYQYPEAILVKA